MSKLRGRNFSYEDQNLLLKLVREYDPSGILHSSQRNAETNSVKDAIWQRIVGEFNEISARPEFTNKQQLRFLYHRIGTARRAQQAQAEGGGPTLEVPLVNPGMEESMHESDSFFDDEDVKPIRLDGRTSMAKSSSSREDEQEAGPAEKKLRSDDGVDPLRYLDYRSTEGRNASMESGEPSSRNREPKWDYSMMEEEEQRKIQEHELKMKLMKKALEFFDGRFLIRK